MNTDTQYPLVVGLTDFIRCPWNPSETWISITHAKVIFADVIFKTPGERGRWLIPVKAGAEMLCDWARAYDVDNPEELLLVPIETPPIREPILTEELAKKLRLIEGGAA